MKVLIIGNSHVAALKQSSTFSQYRLRFAGFSMGYGGFNSLVDFNSGEGLWLSESSPPSQRELWIASTGGTGPVMFSQFDAFLVVGLTPAVNPWEMTNCLQMENSSSQLYGDRPPLSFATYRHISPYQGCVTEANRILGLICRRDENRLVWFVPLPHVRDDSQEFERRFEPPECWKQLSREERDFLQLNEQLLYTRFFRDYGIEALLPPKSLIVDGNRCPAKYSIGALGSHNFNSAAPPQWGSSPSETAENFIHKNSEYGAIWWESIDKLIAKAAGRRLRLTFRGFN